MGVVIGQLFADMSDRIFFMFHYVILAAFWLKSWMFIRTWATAHSLTPLMSYWRAENICTSTPASGGFQNLRLAGWGGAVIINKHMLRMMHYLTEDWPSEKDCTRGLQRKIKLYCFCSGSWGVGSFRMWKMPGSVYCFLKTFLNRPPFTLAGHLAMV